MPTAFQDKLIMITVNFYTTLRLMLNLKEIRVEFDGVQTIDKFLEQVEEIVFQKTAKKFLWKLIEENETIKRGTIILINGKNILDSNGLDCQVKSGDTVALFPPGGGG